MKYTLVIVLMSLLFSLCSAQSEKKVKKLKINTKVESVIDYEDGLKEKRIVQEETFDEHGQLIELKDWSKDGKVKEWVKYSYTEDGQIATEEQYNHKGDLVEKIVYEYKDGLKSKKSYFDHKQRLTKEKFYDYTHY